MGLRIKSNDKKGPFNFVNKTSIFLNLLKRKSSSYINDKMFMNIELNRREDKSETEKG